MTTIEKQLVTDVRFLLERLADFGYDGDVRTDDGERDWHGHVAPAIARTLSALSAYDARPVAGDDVERVRTAQKWAEGLISQLPDTHDGRNSWLLNYGASDEADKIRAKWNHEADQRHAPPSAKYRDLSAIAALPPHDGWQDIATAPRDGTLCLFFAPGRNKAKYIERAKRQMTVVDAFSPQWVNGKYQLPENPYTHWRPLPAPPAAELERTKGNEHG